MTSFTYLKKIISETRYFSYVTFNNLQIHLVISYVVVCSVLHYCCIKALPYMVVHYYKYGSTTLLYKPSLCVGRVACSFSNTSLIKLHLFRKHYLKRKGNLYWCKKGFSQQTNCVKNEILEVFAMKHLAVKTPALLL